MSDILDLPGWSVIGKQLDADGYLIEAKYGQQPDACSKCGAVGSLHRHGPKTVIYRDSPIRGHPVRLLVQLQRYKCRDCARTFLQPVTGIDAGRRMTARCIRHIESQCLCDTFARISKYLGCDEKTIRNIAGDYIARLGAGLCRFRDRNPIRGRLGARKKRCMSCQGIYEPHDLQMTPMAPWLEDEPVVTVALLCAACRTRFQNQSTSAKARGR